jgi:oxygen-independent coproporphyrinogen-3 oxidase
MVKELSLYVHIPFCKRKCLYCDFLSFNAEKEVMDSYFKALEKEITLAGEEYGGFTVRSVFFGGGTPSFPETNKICYILDTVRHSFDVDPRAEISIEVNPASAMYDKLLSYRAAGFNRLSIGAQSLDDRELKCLGRLHDSEMFFETFSNARKAGFDNINVDIMSALPGQSLSTYLKTLDGITALSPEHISAYSLIVEEGTPFYDMDLDLPDEDLDRTMYHETKRILKERGYHRYEISNYARGDGDAFECFHNKVYWRRGNYLGLGLGASSMVMDVRWNSTGELKEYLELTNGAKLQDICRNRQELDKGSKMEEFMFLGLRLVKGVSLKEFEDLFGCDINSVYLKVIEKYKSTGHLETFDCGGGKFLRLTDSGLDVSNTVMADFLLDH